MTSAEGRSCCVRKACTVFDVANRIASFPSFSTGVIKLVEAESKLEFVVECHHSYLCSLAKERVHPTHSFCHVTETIYPNAARGIQEEQDVLDPIRGTVGLSAEALMVLAPVERQGSFF